MKYYSMWIAHIIVCCVFILVTVKIIQSDPNNETRQVDVTVVNTIQENNEDSTSYYGVFELPNGKIISRKINRVIYGSVKAGEEGTLNLNRYDTGEAERDPVRTTGEILLMLLCFLYAFIGTLRLQSYIRKMKDYY